MTTFIRDPADWARDSGWVSRLRAERAANRLLNLADKIQGAVGDEGGDAWAAELRSVATYLDPTWKKREA